MKSHTSLVAQQTRLSEWADLIRDCQNRPQGMKIDEWCQLHDITKASYYWRLRKVREAYLETAEQTQTFVEVPSPAIHPVNMTSEHKCQVILCDIKFKVIHILKVFCEFLYTPGSKTFQIVDNSHKYLKSRLFFSGIHDCYPLSK